MWDSGQFHHQDGHLVSLIDLELGHLGDPMMVLAGWRMRDSFIPFGDFAKIYDRYADLVGEPVDLDAVQLHHFAFTMSSSLSFSDRLRNPVPGTDSMTKFFANAAWLACAVLAHNLTRWSADLGDTLKGQLDLERHGGRTHTGVATRVLQRLLALTVAIWRNERANQPAPRSLIAYDH